MLATFHEHTQKMYVLNTSKLLSSSSPMALKSEFYCFPFTAVKQYLKNYENWNQF